MLIPFQSPLFFTAAFQQNRTRLDDFRLVISRFYKAMPMSVSQVLLIKPLLSINQPQSLHRFFIYWAELLSALENNRGGR
jgi:hypothetical protein